MFEVQMFFVFLIGLCFGSFANVFIYRWPQKLSVVTPRSFCPQCKNSIAWYDNIPVLSWLWLRGRCRHCHAKILIRYPLIEILMGVLFAYSFYRFGVSITFIESVLFLFALLTVSVIDLDHYLLPDIFTLSGIVIGLVGSILNPERNFLDAVLGVFMGGGFLWAIAYFYFAFRKEEGMGGGDIKLLAWIGAVLGWKSIPFVILSSSLVGSVVGLFVAARAKNGLKTVIPFGPYLAFGAVLYMWWGEGLADWYIKLFFPSLN